MPYQESWNISEISLLRRLRQEDQEFTNGLIYMESMKPVWATWAPVSKQKPKKLKNCFSLFQMRYLSSISFAHLSINLRGSTTVSTWNYQERWAGIKWVIKVEYKDKYKQCHSDPPVIPAISLTGNKGIILGL